MPEYRAFPPEHIAEIKARLSLRHAIGKYTELSAHAGFRWHGTCPFCSGPCNIYVWDAGDKSVYMSDGCRAFGDIIGATMRLSDRTDFQHGGISFQEAVERLSEQAEIPV